MGRGGPELLKNLRLRRVPEIYDEQVRAAEKEDVTEAEFSPSWSSSPRPKTSCSCGTGVRAQDLLDEMYASATGLWWRRC
jgi:hypothetical protein